ncbi:MAG: hypothetical protein K2Y21_01270 [Phycisphaerales bacterium]|nr:hypothetical protein [Phycisphaerales bacterium]
MTEPTAPAHGFNPLAGVFALAIPGLGHVFLGQFRRGLFVALGVLGLFLSGLFIGGIDAVDKEEDTLWFIGQAPVGVLTFATNYVHQTKYKGIDPNLRNAPRRMAGPNESINAQGILTPNGTPPAQRSLGRVHDMGILFTVVAGLLNVLAAIDAAFPPLSRKA